MLRGSTEILNTVCDTLGGIKPGQTTKDGKFTIIEVECQGACSNAPMMVIGDDFYVRKLPWWDVCMFLIAPPLPLAQEDLTAETTKKILDVFSKGQKPNPGPQSGRQTSENSAGLTALTSKVCFRHSFLLSPSHHSSSLMVPGNSAPQNLVRSPNTQIR